MTTPEERLRALNGDAGFTLAGTRVLTILAELDALRERLAGVERERNEAQQAIAQGLWGAADIIHTGHDNKGAGTHSEIPRWLCLRCWRTNQARLERAKDFAIWVIAAWETWAEDDPPPEDNEQLELVSRARALLAELAGEAE